MTTKGRYCPPRICWCGNCAWWTPIPEPDYTRLVEAANRAAAAMRKSWEQREESTWMDNL